MDGDLQKHMSDAEKLDAAIGQALADAKVAAATEQRLEEAYIRYIILANAGGIVACLGIADALVNRASSSIPLSPIPMWLFLIGLISGGVIVSLQRAQARHLAEQNVLKVVTLRKAKGDTVPTLPPLFSDIERKGLRYLTRVIIGLGLIGQFCFCIGAVWGLVEVSRYI
jgi:uncharacterized membrane protein